MLLVLSQTFEANQLLRHLQGCVASEQVGKQGKAVLMQLELCPVYVYVDIGLGAYHYSLSLRSLYFAAHLTRQHCYRDVSRAALSKLSSRDGTPAPHCGPQGCGEQKHRQTRSRQTAAPPRRRLQPEALPARRRRPLVAAPAGSWRLPRALLSQSPRSPHPRRARLP